MTLRLNGDGDFVDLRLVLDHLAADLAAVEGEEDFLTGDQVEIGDALEAGSDEFHVPVLAATHGTGFPVGVETHRVAGLGVGPAHVTQDGDGRRLDGVDDARVELPVLARGANPGPDDGALGQPLTGRHLENSQTKKHT